MSNHNELQALSSDQLIEVNGGLPEWVKPVAGFVGKKVLGPVSAAWTAYDAADGFLTAREQGKGVGESLIEGGKNALF
jgi:hypothetical protein